MAARRTYGTGSITARGKGRWLVRIDLGTDPLTGARVRPSRVVVGTKADAQNVYDDLASKRLTGRNISTEVPLGQLVAMWRSQVDHATGTERNYDKAFALLPAALLDTPARKVQALALDNLYRALESSGAAVDNIRYLHAGLSGTFTQAVKWGLLASNPARAATPPVAPKRRQPKVASSMPAKLIAATTDPQERAWVALVCTTGARRSELLAIQWQEVDLEAGIVEIFTALDPTAQDPMTLKGTKNGDFRTLPLGGLTLRSLREWRAKASERAGGTLAPDAWTFSLDPLSQRPWRPDYATKRWRKVAGRAGVDLHLHGARHLVASMAADAGFSARARGDYLGQRDEKTTGGYTHAVPERAREIADAMDSLIFPPGVT